jgi:hypothetical protein
MKRGSYCLEVIARPENQYGLALSEVITAPTPTKGGQESRQVVRIWGSAMQAVYDRIVEAVKANRGRASDIRLGRKSPFPLDEESAVRLGLLLLAIKPLRKMSRIEAIREATATMGAEEAYYWYSKCASPSYARRATRAFRILHAQE